MATHFARGILNTREPLSTRLSAACHQSARRLPEYRQSRYRASRSLLAELLFMLYGISELPKLLMKKMENPLFATNISRISPSPMLEISSASR